MYAIDVRIQKFEIYDNKDNWNDSLVLFDLYPFESLVYKPCSDNKKILGSGTLSVFSENELFTNEDYSQHNPSQNRLEIVIKKIKSVLVTIYTKSPNDIMEIFAEGKSPLEELETNPHLRGGFLGTTLNSTLKVIFQTSAKVFLNHIIGAQTLVGEIDLTISIHDLLKFHKKFNNILHTAPSSSKLQELSNKGSLLTEEYIPETQDNNQSVFVHETDVQEEHHVEVITTVEQESYSEDSIEFQRNKSEMIYSVIAVDQNNRTQEVLELYTRHSNNQSSTFRRSQSLDVVRGKNSRNSRTYDSKYQPVKKPFVISCSKCHCKECQTSDIDSNLRCSACGLQVGLSLTQSQTLHRTSLDSQNYLLPRPLQDDEEPLLSAPVSVLKSTSMKPRLASRRSQKGRYENSVSVSDDGLDVPHKRQDKHVKPYHHGMQYNEKRFQEGRPQSALGSERFDQIVEKIQRRGMVSVSEKHEHPVQKAVSKKISTLSARKESLIRSKPANTTRNPQPIPSKRTSNNRHTGDLSGESVQSSLGMGMGKRGERRGIKQSEITVLDKQGAAHPLDSVHAPSIDYNRETSQGTSYRHFQSSIKRSSGANNTFSQAQAQAKSESYSSQRQAIVTVMVNADTISDDFLSIETRAPAPLIYYG